MSKDEFRMNNLEIYPKNSTNFPQLPRNGEITSHILVYKGNYTCYSMNEVDPMSTPYPSTFWWFHILSLGVNTGGPPEEVDIKKSWQGLWVRVSDPNYIKYNFAYHVCPHACKICITDTYKYCPSILVWYWINLVTGEKLCELSHPT